MKVHGKSRTYMISPIQLVLMLSSWKFAFRWATTVRNVFRETANMHLRLLLLSPSVLAQIFVNVGYSCSQGKLYCGSALDKLSMKACDCSFLLARSRQLCWRWYLADSCYERPMEQILYQSDQSMDHDQIWPNMLWNCMGPQGVIEYNGTCVGSCVDEEDDSVDDHCDAAGIALHALPPPAVTAMRWVRGHSNNFYLEWSVICCLSSLSVGSRSEESLGFLAKFDLGGFWVLAYAWHIASNSILARHQIAPIPDMNVSSVNDMSGQILFRKFPTQVQLEDSPNHGLWLHECSEVPRRDPEYISLHLQKPFNRLGSSSTPVETFIIYQFPHSAHMRMSSKCFTNNFHIVVESWSCHHNATRSGTAAWSVDCPDSICPHHGSQLQGGSRLLWPISSLQRCVSSDCYFRRATVLSCKNELLLIRLPLLTFPQRCLLRTNNLADVIPNECHNWLRLWPAAFPLRRRKRWCGLIQAGVSWGLLYSRCGCERLLCHTITVKVELESTVHWS